MKRAIFILLSIVVFLGMRGQIIPSQNEKDYADSIRREYDNRPYFSLYKDNYFTLGTSIHPAPSRTNSDVKFQISISQRLTKSVLPWHTYLFLAYTQKTFWNVFEKSLPMRDLNFNPGIGITKPFFNKDRFVGQMTLMLEHESNGRDGLQSRSWNKVSLSGCVLIDQWLMVHGKIWIPIIDGENNKDILKYSGIFQNTVSVTTPNKKFNWSLTLVKRLGLNLNFNTTFEFSWMVHKKSNQYLFIQYYNGYGENLLDYKVFHNRIRAGIVIKPKFFSEF